MLTLGLFEIEDEGTSVSEGKKDHRGNIDKMVNLFGSERQKRAFSASQRNRVDDELLEGVLEPAFSHAQAKVDDMSPLVGLLAGSPPPPSPLLYIVIFLCQSYLL